MIADKLQAQDDVNGMFTEGWNTADWSPIDSTVLSNPPPSPLPDPPIPVIRYEGVEVNDTPSINLPFCRIKMQHVDGSQAGFSLGSKLKRKYCRVGIVSVQSFGPLGGGRGLEIATYMAIIAEGIFLGVTSANGIWFRRVRSTEVGKGDSWYQVNTTIDFEYNEVR